MVGIAVIAKVDMMDSYFINPRGYSLDKVRNDRYLLILKKVIYEFTLKEDNPLTYCSYGIQRIRPDRHLAETDMGSIPLSLQMFLPKDEFLLSYIFHDSTYKHKGLYFENKATGKYEFRELTRAEADRLLLEMIRAEGGGIVKSRIIWVAVRSFGRFSWKN